MYEILYLQQHERVDTREQLSSVWRAHHIYAPSCKVHERMMQMARGALGCAYHRLSCFAVVGWNTYNELLTGQGQEQSRAEAQQECGSGTQTVGVEALFELLDRTSEEEGCGDGDQVSH